MINVLKRITELREAHHWTEYQLAEHSGLTQSTISSWYRKQMLPTIPSLVKYVMLLESLYHSFSRKKNEQTVHLTEKQASLLAASAKLSSEQYDALLSFIELL